MNLCIYLLQGDALILCENLVVLYLYDNNLTKIPNLPKVTILTHLYLQNNRIRELDGIGAFRRLTKLYVFPTSSLLYY